MNRYAPPEAEVADPTPPRRSIPPQIQKACWLILASLVLGIISLLPAIRPPAPDDQPVSIVVSLIVIFLFSALTVWFILGILRGKNWARWVMLVFLGTGWLLAGSELESEFVRVPLAATIDVVCITMETVACWLLFFGRDATWFSRLEGT